MGNEAKNTSGDIYDMSYSTLDKIYPESTKISVGTHRAFIGGVVSSWDAFNYAAGVQIQPKKIADAYLFANFQTSNFDTDYVESPWKIHLSIHPNDLGNAWDLIYPILLENQVAGFKTTRTAVSQIMFEAMRTADEQFLHDNSLTLQDKEQAMRDILRVTDGMQITLYIDEGKEQQYNKLLEIIEPLFYQAGIRPGVIDKSDRSIGIYSSVRHVGKGYISHEKVAGYKAVEEVDPFKAIKPIWKDVQIKWHGLKYDVHIDKAKEMLQQVVDAERKYKTGTYTKQEFIQICTVSTEYFNRWHSLLKRTEAVALAKLPTRDQASFAKLKKWVEHGHQYVPSIRKNNIRKIKEAEDALSTTQRYDRLNAKPARQLKRKNAEFSLNKHFLAAQKVKIDSGAKTKSNGNSLPVFVELFQHRKKSLKASVRRQSLSTSDDMNTVPMQGAKQEPVRDEAFVDGCSSTLQQRSTTPSKASAFYLWVVGGALIGVGLGLISSLFLAPWTLGLSLSLLPVAGMIIGGVIGFYREHLAAEQTTGTEPQKDNLLMPTEPETKAEMQNQPHYSKGLRMFSHHVEEQPLLDDKKSKMLQKPSL